MDFLVKMLIPNMKLGQCIRNMGLHVDYCGVLKGLGSLMLGVQLVGLLKHQETMKHVCSSGWRCL